MVCELKKFGKDWSKTNDRAPNELKRKLMHIRIATILKNKY
jgi:hypothetical protein